MADPFLPFWKLDNDRKAFAAGLEGLDALESRLKQLDLCSVEILEASEVVRDSNKAFRERGFCDGIIFRSEVDEVEKAALRL